MGVTIEADIIKQKQPENNGGYTSARVRQDRPARLRRADDRQPDRPDAAGRSSTATRAGSGSSISGGESKGCGRPRPGGADAL